MLSPEFVQGIVVLLAAVRRSTEESQAEREASCFATLKAMLTVGKALEKVRKTNDMTLVGTLQDFVESLSKRPAQRDVGKFCVVNGVPRSDETASEVRSALEKSLRNAVSALSAPFSMTWRTHQLPRPAKVLIA
jgi:hypothetical protein